jgi:hypothetical protein
MGQVRMLSPTLGTWTAGRLGYAAVPALSAAFIASFLLLSPVPPDVWRLLRRPASGRARPSEGAGAPGHGGASEGGAAAGKDE